MLLWDLDRRMRGGPMKKDKEVKEETVVYFPETYLAY